MADRPLVELQGKVAAIVGGGSGIGEAVAAGAAWIGARVTILDANADAARRVALAVGGESHALDIRDGAAVRTALDAVAARSGRLDVVVCTPSINVRKRILDYKDAEFDRVVGVNLKGNFNVLQ